MYETEELRSLKWPFSHVISADAYPILENHCEALEQDKANCLVLPLLLLDRSNNHSAHVAARQSK